MNCHKDPLIPIPALITDIRAETPDVKTFRVVSGKREKPFEYIPGQCAMLSFPGVGEALFSITSSPTNTSYQEFSVKRCGSVTDWLHSLEPDSQIMIRGPYGNGFPVDTAFKGKDLLFIGGGIGLAPLRSAINYVRGKRADYGKTDIVYGAKSKDDLVQYEEITNVWGKDESINIHLTVDKAEPGWNGHVGFVPDFVRELGVDPGRIAILCGPPVMINITLGVLNDLGFARDRIYTTLELKMKCGIGKCGRCNIGSKYVCRDGPVFRRDQLDAMPDEY